MNRQEFIAAHRDARKVLAFEAAMRQARALEDGMSSAAPSLYSEIPDAAWYAANAPLAKCGRGDILVHGYFRDRRDGRLDRLSLRCHRPVRLPE